MRHRALFGIIYTVVYFVLAVMLLGGGHGSFSFIAPLFTWVLLFIPIFLSTRLTGTTSRILFVIPILLHYIHIVIFLYGPSPEHLEKEVSAWSKAPLIVAFAVLWYLAGQFLLWWTFLKSFKK